MLAKQLMPRVERIQNEAIVAHGSIISDHIYYLF